MRKPRPTPETDAKASPHIGFYSCATVPANFARALERERDEAREQNQAMREAIREAHTALSLLDDCRLFHADSMDIDGSTTDYCATTLVKLQPFLP